MIGEIAGYAIASLTAVGAVVFGVKRASAEDKTGIAARLKDVESNYDRLNQRVQMLERREIWHERKEGILMDILAENHISLPPMPPAPESYTS